MGDREARTQAALVCGHTGAAEDAASRRPARPDGTSVIVNRALKPDPVSADKPLLGDGFERALTYAIRLHREQTRKGSGVPKRGTPARRCFTRTRGRRKRRRG